MGGIRNIKESDLHINYETACDPRLNHEQSIELAFLIADLIKKDKEKNMTKISGYGDNLTINGTRIGDLSPNEHENIEKEKGGQNYSPLENVVVSHVKDSSTLICRKPSKDNISNYIEEELLDGLCCYSAVNQGQLNETIVDAVISHLRDEKLPTVPRSIRHKYMSAFLLASTSFTEMDRVVPKVAGVESWELTFKLCRRWGYHVKKFLIMNVL